MKNLTPNAGPAKPHGVRYPWDEWFGIVRLGRPITIRRGVDYFSMPHGMDQLIRNVAASDRYRLRVSVHIQPDESIRIGPPDSGPLRLPPRKSTRRRKSRATR